MDIYTKRTIKALAGELVNWKSLVAAVLIAVIFGWIPDGLTGLIYNITKSSNFVAGVQITTATIILLLIFFYARSQAKVQLLYRVEPINKDMKRFKALVIFLSSVKEELMPECRKISSMEDFKLIKKPLAWEMPLIALREHIESLEILVVMSSKESHAQINEFKELAKRIFPTVERLEILTPNPVNFENIEKIQESLEEVYKGLEGKGLKESDILIDITGGQKPVSIAGASTTVIYPNRYFQYVSTNTKEVRIYNMNILETES